MLAQRQRPDERTNVKPVPSDGQLEGLLQQLKITATPLLAPLTVEERTAAGTVEASPTHDRIGC
jgi:hypothetical protein